MKIKVIAMLAVAVLLLGSIAIFTAVTVWGGKAQDGGSVAVLSIIVLFAAAMVAWAMIEKRALERKTERLGTAAKMAYERIYGEIRSSPLSPAEKRDLCEGILDTLIAAQEDGKEASSITGEDPVAFAREALGAYGVRTNAYTWILDSLMTFIGYLAGIQVFNAVRTPGLSFFSTGIEAKILIFFALISLVLPLLGRAVLSAKKGNAAYVIPLLVLPLAVAGLFIGFIELMRANAARWPSLIAFMSRETVPFPNLFALGAGAIAFAGCWLLKRNLRRRRENPLP
jgi:DNA-binding ferritin-like protein (Dps family)